MEEKKKGIWDRLFSIFIAIVIIVMCVEILLLVKQNRELKAKLEKQATVPLLKEGEKLPGFISKDIYGEDVTVDYAASGKKTLLLAFSPACPACQKNMDNWIALNMEHNPEKVRIVGVTVMPLDETRKFAEDNNLDFTVTNFPDDEIRKHYKIAYIPTTILMNETGEVEKVSQGVLSDEDMEYYRSLF